MVKRIIPLLFVPLLLIGCERPLNKGSDADECLIINMDRANSDIAVKMLAQTCNKWHGC